MQFTTRRFLFICTLLAIEAAAIARGWTLNDHSGAIAAGVFMLPGLLILTLLVYRWKKERLVSRIVALPVLLLFLLPLFMNLEPSEETTNRRLAVKLQTEFARHPKFRSVKLRYVPRTSQRKSVDWVETTGWVETIEDLNELRLLVEDRLSIPLQVRTVVAK